MIREYKTVEEIVSPLMMVRMVENVTYNDPGHFQGQLVGGGQGVLTDELDDFVQAGLLLEDAHGLAPVLHEVKGFRSGWPPAGEYVKVYEEIGTEMEAQIAEIAAQGGDQ